MNANGALKELMQKCSISHDDLKESPAFTLTTMKQFNDFVMP